MSEEVKSCERCASSDWLFSQPRFFRVSEEGSTPVGWVTGCQHCGIKVEHYSKTEAEAIWNTRPIEDTLRAQIAAAQIEIADLEHNRKDNTALLWKVEQQQRELERLRKTDVTFEMNFGDRTAHCQELSRQEYTDCTFSAGLVSGTEPDTIYLRLARDEPTTLFLRPDEAQAIITILSGALWVGHIADLQEAGNGQ